MTAMNFDGIYELVSETIALTKPEIRTQQITSDQWSGLWFFQGNRYSQTVMKTRRSWPPFPRGMDELGYESSAGEFEIKGEAVILRPALSLSPFGLIHSKTLEFRIEGDNLTLIETTTPSMENLAEGKRVTVLRRVK
jgi:hypothetical protein